MATPPKLLGPAAVLERRTASGSISSRCPARRPASGRSRDRANAAQRLPRSWRRHNCTWVAHHEHAREHGVPAPGRRESAGGLHDEARTLLPRKQCAAPYINAWRPVAASVFTQTLMTVLLPFPEFRRLSSEKTRRENLRSRWNGSDPELSHERARAWHAARAAAAQRCADSATHASTSAWSAVLLRGGVYTAPSALRR